MKWVKNLISIGNANDSGLCPYCGSKNTDCCFSIVDEENNIGYGDIWCNECLRGYHLSRVKIVEGMRTNVVIPPNIKY